MNAFRSAVTRGGRLAPTIVLDLDETVLYRFVVSLRGLANRKSHDVNSQPREAHSSALWLRPRQPQNRKNDFARLRAFRCRTRGILDSALLYSQVPHALLSRAGLGVGLPYPSAVAAIQRLSASFRFVSLCYSPSSPSGVPERSSWERKSGRAFEDGVRRDAMNRLLATTIHTKICPVEILRGS